MSKAEKMKAKLASFQKEREQFEQQKKCLEAEMNIGKQNMGRINKGLRNNEIVDEPIVLDSPGSVGQGNFFFSPKNRGKRDSSSKKTDHSSAHPSPFHNPGNHPSGTLSPGHVHGSSTPPPGGHQQSHSTVQISIASLMPTGPRISEWCYVAPLDSAPPIVKSRELYENIRILGRGAFGEVNLVKNIEDNKLFAIKSVFCAKESEMHAVLREIRYLRTYRHPCIIDVHDSFMMTNPRIIYIVMHYCESAENQIVKWVLQIALALQFLHANQMVHRDLKPMNIMLTDGGDLIKVADFGLAINVASKRNQAATDEAGTPYYTAPEMIRQERYSAPADCWSFGIILHQLLSLDRPFGGNSTNVLVRSILTAEPPPLPTHYSEEIRQICIALLIKDQTNRLNMEALLMDNIFFYKVVAFPQQYRPKFLEERIRRAHTKQLEHQIELVSITRKTLMEQVAAKLEFEAEQAALIAASVAATPAVVIQSQSTDNAENPPNDENPSETTEKPSETPSENPTESTTENKETTENIEKITEEANNLEIETPMPPRASHHKSTISPRTKQISPNSETPTNPVSSAANPISPEKTVAHGGRKGLEIAKALMEDKYYEGKIVESAGK